MGRLNRGTKAARVSFVGTVRVAAEPHTVPSINCLKLLDLGCFYEPSCPQGFSPVPSCRADYPKAKHSYGAGSSGLLIPSHGLGRNSGEGAAFPAPSFPGEPKEVQLCSGEILSRSGGSLGSLGSVPRGSDPPHSPFPPCDLPSMQHPPRNAKAPLQIPGKIKNCGIVAFLKGRYPQSRVTAGSCPWIPWDGLKVDPHGARAANLWLCRVYFRTVWLQWEGGSCCDYP